eukprot:4258697-Alexandrium_andersonii.AAC.1
MASKLVPGTVCSAPFLVQIPNPLTKWVKRGGPTSRTRKVASSNPQSANLQSAQSCAIDAREAS